MRYLDRFIKRNKTALFYKIAMNVESLQIILQMHFEAAVAQLAERWLRTWTGVHRFEIRYPLKSVVCHNGGPKVLYIRFLEAERYTSFRDFLPCECGY